MQVEGQEIEEARGAPVPIIDKEHFPEWLNELLELDPAAETRIRKFPIRSDPMSPPFSRGNSSMNRIKICAHHRPSAGPMLHRTVILN
jgi:hypothetical protein